MRFRFTNRNSCGPRHRRLARVVAATAVIACCGSSFWFARAASTTGSVNVSVLISARAKLMVSSSTITFNNADPDSTPSIPANEGTISITAKAKTSTGSMVTLTIRADADLKSGGDAIPAGNVQWTASGTGFVPGALSWTADQTVASWTGSGVWSGSQVYTLVNSWSYPTGTYTATASYTLTAP